MILILEKKQLRKTILTVLVLGFFIVSPHFVSAQTLETENKITVDRLESQVQNIQSQLGKAKLILLETIEQRVLKIKKKIFVLGQEVQKMVELSKAGKLEEEKARQEKAGVIKKEETAQATTTEATTEATTTQATSTEAVKGEATSTEATSTEATSTKTIEETAEETAVSGSGGGGGGPATPAADETAPSAITDLSASNPTITSIDVSWSSPGDNANSGTATSYDLRYATVPINDSNWSSATQVTDEPTPSLAGSTQSMTVSGLAPNTTYYFAIETSDEVPNESELSNVASGTTNQVAECSTSVASGAQTYFVRTQNQPQIMQIDIDPLDVAIGETQTVTAKIRDTNDNSITAVNGTVQLDNGLQAFTLSLISGETTNGTWEGSWSPNDTFCTTYFLTISATSATGQSTVELAFR